MFEAQYNEEMETEVKRLEAKQRATLAGHPEWDNACSSCQCELNGTDLVQCIKCGTKKS